MQAIKEYDLENLQIPFLKRILENLPEELTTCYDRILKQIPARFPEDLRYVFFTALKWLVLAQRPLYVEEVAESCMIDGQPGSFDETRYVTPRDVINKLQGLVRLEPPLDYTIINVEASTNPTGNTYCDLSTLLCLRISGSSPEISSTTWTWCARRSLSPDLYCSKLSGLITQMPSRK